MKRITLILPALCGFALISVGAALAQSPQPKLSTHVQPSAKASRLRTDAVPETNSLESTNEVETLKHRLDEVETQNRALKQALIELKTRVDVLSHAPIANSNS